MSSRSSSHPSPLLDRRRFLEIASGTTLTALGMLASAETPTSTAQSKPHSASNPLPRWRGFNLTNFFQALSRGEEGSGVLREDDLRWIRDWGFDYVRLPMDYWLWIDSDWRATRKLTAEDTLKLSEAGLEKIDRAIDLGRQYGLHVTLNLHRAPGYCINNPDREPFVLWSDEGAQDAFVFHWETLARRYRGISAEVLSFNLVNEAPSPRPGYMTRADYARIMGRATRVIREISPERIVHVDGLSVGTEVATELIPLGVAQSVHAYWPAQISHFRASWVDRDSGFAEPSWPLRDADGSVRGDRRTLEERYAPWGALAREGIGVHCGECGGYNKTPYPVFLAWFTDVLDILQSHSIGYALWNFRGSFGVLDSGRSDITYEDWQGHKLDRTLLNLLRDH